MAAFTTPGPPVTTSRRTPGWRINSSALSMVGRSMQQSSDSGPPAAEIASFKRCTRYADVLAAYGWALNTTAFPPATMPIPLLRTVSVGLVVGVIDPMTP